MNYQPVDFKLRVEEWGTKRPVVPAHSRTLFRDSLSLSFSSRSLAPPEADPLLFSVIILFRLLFCFRRLRVFGCLSIDHSFDIYLFVCSLVCLAGWFFSISHGGRAKMRWPVSSSTASPAASPTTFLAQRSSSLFSSSSWCCCFYSLALLFLLCVPLRAAGATTSPRLLSQHSSSSSSFSVADDAARKIVAEKEASSSSIFSSAAAAAESSSLLEYRTNFCYGRKFRRRDVCDWNYLPQIGRLRVIQSGENENDQDQEEFDVVEKNKERLRNGFVGGVVGDSSDSLPATSADGGSGGGVLPSSRRRHNHTRFAIFMQNGRVGSTWLVSLLNSVAKGIDCQGEQFDSNPCKDKGGQASSSKKQKKWSKEGIEASVTFS